MSVRKLLAVAALASVLPATAIAHEDHEGAFIGGGAGAARVNGGNYDGSEVGWKAFAGYDFSKYIGLEGAYNDLGNHKGKGVGDARFNVYDAALLVMLPLGGSGISLLGKGGVAFPDVSGKGADDEQAKREGFWGAGLRARLGDHGLGMRVEYERFRFGKNVDFPSVSLEWQF